MANETQVKDLLVLWEERREQGRSVTPEELCSDCPDLLDELKRRIRALESVAALLNVPSTQPAAAAGSGHGDRQPEDGSSAARPEAPRGIPPVESPAADGLT